MGGFPCWRRQLLVHKTAAFWELTGDLLYLFLPGFSTEVFQPPARLASLSALDVGAVVQRHCLAVVILPS